LLAGGLGVGKFLWTGVLRTNVEQRGTGQLKQFS
jgi:hypothetical protein